MQAQATTTVREILESIAAALPFEVEVKPGLSGAHDAEIRYHESLAWGVSGRLEMGIRELQDSPTGRVGRIRIAVNSGSTDRGPAEARAFAVIMAKLADAACLAEAICGDRLYAVELPDPAKVAS